MGNEEPVTGKAIGGKARADSLSPLQRQAIAKKAAEARWSKEEEAEIEPEIASTTEMPIAWYRGNLPILGTEVPCYVLSNGLRVVGRTSATELLTGIKGGGALEKYLGVAALKPYINMDLVLERMVAFRLPEVDGLEKAVKGLSADLMIEICQGFVAALNASYDSDTPPPKLSSRQVEMAIKATLFLSACAKVGLDALIDEATGYQYEREQDALQIKLKAYLAEEMRKWERTFPDDLWIEFGRLTGWKGKISHRPKYWGKLVMELVYEYLDPDVAKWLKENAPTPRYGQNYHQWLSNQYGLKKLVEHIWMLIGVAKTCKDMRELRDKMAELNGKVPVQFRLYLPMPKRE